MRSVDCVLGMQVIDKTNGFKGTIVAGNPFTLDVLVRDDNSGKEFIYHAGSMLSSRAICNLEEIKGEKKTMKITPKYINRMRNSKHVQGKIQELCDYYAFDNSRLSVCLWFDGMIKLIPSWIEGVTARAKCHPDDKFDINKGLELAFARLAEKLGVSPKWEPKEGKTYFYVFTCDKNVSDRSFHKGWFSQELDASIGNCFKTRKEANEHAPEIIERYQKLIAYAKELNK